MTNAEARFNKSLRPRKPEGSLGRTAQDGHLDSHTAPELSNDNYAGIKAFILPPPTPPPPVSSLNRLLPATILSSFIFFFLGGGGGGGSWGGGLGWGGFLLLFVSCFVVVFMGEWGVLRFFIRLSVIHSAIQFIFYCFSVFSAFKKQTTYATSARAVVHFTCIYLIWL